MGLLVTASQTLGPFGAISFEQTQIADVASPGVGGERVSEAHLTALRKQAKNTGLLVSDKGVIRACEHNARALIAPAPQYASLYFDEFLSRMRIRGRVLDADGNPVNDAMVETWQANAHGKYAHPDDAQEKPLDDKFKGFGRVQTDSNGVFRLATIKPGRLPGPGGVLQAPHLVAVVFMRGLLKHLVTRIYFPDEPGNADDPILKFVPAERRATLIAKKIAGEQGMLEWNILLQ